MHSFLKSIGFSDLDNKSTRELIKDIISNPDSKKLVSTEGEEIQAEYRRLFSQRFGIAVCGQYSEEEGFDYEYYYPFFVPYHVSTVAETEVEKHLSSDAMSGMCDDYKVGVTMIFFLQNRLDHLKESFRQKKGRVINQVLLSGLASGGTILMPIKKSVAQIKRTSRVNNKRRDLIAQAMDGNEEAMEKLTVSDMELGTQVLERSRSEDVYTLVDTYFMPYGAQSELYSVMGEILEAKTVINSLTNEEIYIINIVCNDLNIEVCINRKDLLGEPETGRRFKGNIWLQGVIEGM